MNVIVANQYKDLLTASNIQVMKLTTGVFKVSELVNSFNGMYYQKIIIDATSINEFPKKEVLKELAKRFDTEKLILFLPPDNPPPQNFLAFLVSINIYNFSDNVRGLLQLVNKSNTYEDVKQFLTSKKTIENKSNNDFEDMSLKTNFDGQNVILGIKNVTKDAGSIELIYMLQQNLTRVFHKKVISIEIDKNDFACFNDKNMISISSKKLGEFFYNNSSFDIALIDLGNGNINDICNDIIYLVEPSLYRINQLMLSNNRIFDTLKGKKVLLNKCLLGDRDINIFAKEAGISIYYSLPPLNDRLVNDAINNLLSKLGLVDEINESNDKKGLFSFFK